MIPPSLEFEGFLGGVSSGTVGFSGSCFFGFGLMKNVYATTTETNNTTISAIASAFILTNHPRKNLRNILTMFVRRFSLGS